MSGSDTQASVQINEALKSMLKGSAPIISTDKLADSVSKGSNWVIFDSREFIEFEISHLPNALWVGHLDFSLTRVADTPKDSKIAVYCSIGVRSEKIAEKLMACGFSDVWNLYGGIFAWANEHKALVAKDQEPTLTVHGYDKTWAKLVNNPFLTVKKMTTTKLNL